MSKCISFMHDDQMKIGVLGPEEENGANRIWILERKGQILECPNGKDLCIVKLICRPMLVKLTVEHVISDVLVMEIRYFAENKIVCLGLADIFGVEPTGLTTFLHRGVFQSTLLDGMTLGNLFAAQQPRLQLYFKQVQIAGLIQRKM